MRPDELIDRLGGYAVVAQRLGIASKFTVGNWRKRGFPAWALIGLRELCDADGIDPNGALDPQPRAKTEDAL